MSCHSQPGNRATLTIARFTAADTLGARSPVPEAKAQRSFHALLSEGRELKIGRPEASEVERWFDDAEYQAASVIPSGRSRTATLANLEAEWVKYEKNPEALTGDVFHAWQHTPGLLSYTEGRQVHPDPRRIAVDLDGCLYDFTSIMREWLVARGWKRDQLPDPETYSLTKSWSMSTDLLRTEMSKALAAGVLFRRGEAYEDGIAHVREIGLQGHHIVVNTARQFPGLELEARRATVQWLRDNDIHADEVALVGLQGGVEKTRVPFDLLIDDSPENVHAAHAAGRNAILLDREWNRDEEHVRRMSYRQISGEIDVLAG